MFLDIYFSVSWVLVRIWSMTLSKKLAVRMLREELQLLQEPGSYVGEVVKVMGKNKVLVKVSNIPIWITQL